MTREDVTNNVLANYGGYGIDRKTIEKLLDSGLKEGLSRQPPPPPPTPPPRQEYGEHALFTTKEVSEALGVSEEMVIQEIEKAKEELLEYGKNPSDYFLEADQEERSASFFRPDT